MHELYDAAAHEAARLVRERGIPPSVAVRIAADAAVEIQRSGRGFGAVTDVVKDVAESAPVKEARELVSPWLWVLSLVSFGMAVTNYQRVGRMYQKWKRGRRAS